MLKFAVSACRICRPDSRHPPKGLSTYLPRWGNAANFALTEF